VLIEEDLAIKEQEKEKVVRANILTQGKREYMNTLLTKVIVNQEILVSTLQKEETIVASNEFHNTIATSFLRFLNPTIHALCRQVDAQ
jgi:hypothetical protein